MGPSGFEDIGARLHVIAAAPAAASYNSGTSTAAGVYTTTGVTLDRRSGTTGGFPRQYESCKLAVPVTITLGTGTARTMTLRAQLKTRQTTSGTGSTWDTLATGTKTISKTTATVAAAEDRATQILTIDANLRPAARYLKINYQKLFSSTVTGTTVSIGPALLIAGGASENPAAG